MSSFLFVALAVILLKNLHMSPNEIRQMIVRVDDQLMKGDMLEHLLKFVPTEEEVYIYCSRSSCMDE